MTGRRNAEQQRKNFKVTQRLFFEKFRRFNTENLGYFKRGVSMKKNILLVIDDDSSVRAATHLAFERDFEVVSASNESEALDIFDSVRPDVIFLDIIFHKVPKGWDILKQIRERDSKVVILITTSLHLNKAEVLQKQADGYFEKPFDHDKVREFLIGKRLLDRENSQDL